MRVRGLGLFGRGVAIEVGGGSCCVELDGPLLGRRVIRVPTPLVLPSADVGELAPGVRVMMTDYLYQGTTGTIVRSTWLLWRRAWLVEFDDHSHVRRERALPSVLVPIAEENES